MSIKAVLFDFIGTIVIEQDPLVLNSCFVDAFKDHGVDVSIELIRTNRGKDKKQMIDDILSGASLALDLTEPVLGSFRKRLTNSLDNFCENEGAAAVMNELAKAGIRIGLGTGLPRDTFEAIFNHLGWNKKHFDYTGIAEEIGKGRPHPDMIFDMMKRLGLGPDELIKVGDTVADVQEGKNAGVKTVAILSGTQDEQKIIDQRPDFIIRSLKELKEIIRSEKDQDTRTKDQKNSK
jgi:HAD superfamily hydrolase (TIGR01549 family)